MLISCYHSFSPKILLQRTRSKSLMTFARILFRKVRNTIFKWENSLSTLTCVTGTPNTVVAIRYSSFSSFFSLPSQKRRTFSFLGKRGDLENSRSCCLTSFCCVLVLSARVTSSLRISICSNLSVSPCTYESKWEIFRYKSQFIIVYIYVIFKKKKKLCCYWCLL